MEYLKQQKDATSLSFKVEAKGQKQKFNELVQLRSDIILELRKTVEIIAEGSTLPANYYVESIVTLIAFLGVVGEPLDGIKLWTEFDKSETELLWKVSIIYKAVKNCKEFLFQVQLNKSIDEKFTNKKTDEIGEKAIDSPKIEDSSLKLKTIGWDKHREGKKRSSIFRIQANTSEERLKPSTSEISLQSKLSLQARKKVSNPMSKISLERVKFGKTDIIPRSLHIDERYWYQLELANKEKEIMQEFEKRFKLRLISIKGEEKRNSKAFLILFKKACMVFGRYEAELFIRKEFNISMSIFFKRYDIDHSFWHLD